MSRLPPPRPRPTRRQTLLAVCPKKGIIVETVTYNLIADCTLTGPLEIKTSQTSSITLTINGGGRTISNTSFLGNTGLYYLHSFLVVDDDGEETVQNVDNERSPDVKVVIKNVTFDGSDLRFRRPPRLQPDNVVRRSAIGAGILVDGALTMENVTFTRGGAMWVRVKGTASLKNVLFENSKIFNWGMSSTVKGVLHVGKTGSATLNNAVFRDIETSVIAIEKGGSLSASGCLSFTRVLTHKVHHSGLHSGLGSWSDSSSGACGDIEIGNKGKAVVAYSYTTLPCKLPKNAVISENTVYTLTQDCVCFQRLVVSPGVTVTINGNGKRIVGCEDFQFHFSSRTYGPMFVIGGDGAHLKITNATLVGIRVRNMGGNFTFGNSILRDTSPTPILNYGWAYFVDSLFENNRGYVNSQGKGDGEGTVYYAHAHYGLGRALFTDNVFRNNFPPGDSEAFATGEGASIVLCGENVREGGSEVQLPSFIVEQGNATFGCPDHEPSPGTPSALVECAPERTNLPENKMMGAIGIIIHKQKCPPIIEIWEVFAQQPGTIRPQSEPE